MKKKLSILGALLLSLTACALAPFPDVSKPYAVTQGPHEHLLANYYAINAWSPDHRYLLALETDLNGRLPEAGERCTLGLVDLRDGNRFIPVTTTACWNFQEAAMAHWLPNEKDTILFNDLRDGKFVAVILNWRTKQERIVPHPVSAVSRDGTWAVSINYARLSLTRPDYGYAGPGQDPRETVEWPEDDGLWIVDLKTGAARLVLSVAQGRALMPATKAEAGKPGQPLAYYCHTVISKDDRKIFFLARSVDWFDKATHKASRWQTTSFTVDVDGKNLRRCFRDGWGGSHFNWAPDGSHRMLVTAFWDGDKKEGGARRACGPVEFTVGEEDKVRHVGKGALDQDWHCLYSPDGKFMSGETYWNASFRRPWVLVRLEDDMTLPLGAFWVPEAYRQTYWRCDLHARWRDDGGQIAFNSVHEGSRQIYLMDVRERRYLDEMDLSDATCGLNRRPQARRSLLGNAIRLGDKVYDRGVGTHAESVIFLKANGKVRSFDAMVGIDREAQEYPASWCTRKNWGCVSFRAYVDGKLVADSGVLKEQDAPKPFHLDLLGAKEIVLECTDGGHWAGYMMGHGDWADAVFTLDPGGSIVADRGRNAREQLGILTPPVPAEPRINGASVWGVRPGHPVIYRVPVSGEKPLKLSVAGLPAGATFDAATGVIGGTVAQAGDYPVVVTAENAKGKSVRTITLKVGEKICLTPPMGWNSWNIWGGGVSDRKIRDAARAMHESGLGEHGWSYVNIDDWWQNNPKAGKDDPSVAAPERLPDGTINPNRRFPDMKALADYIHGFGFKAGLYSSPGAYTCGGCTGSYRHEMQDAQTWAKWGFDYVKHDWCSYGEVFGRETKGRKPTVDDYAKPYRLMSECLRAQNRDIVHAFCQYGMGDVQSWGEAAGANVWRSWGDLKDSWTCLIKATESYADAWKYTRPGFWCDPDMMVLGVVSTADGRHATYLSRNEQYTHMSLWCLLNSPLLLGNDLTEMDAFTKSLLVNDEILAVNQDPLGRQAGRVFNDVATDIWSRPMANGDTVCGIVNRFPFTRDVYLRWSFSGLSGKYAVRDLWRQQDIGVFEEGWHVNVPAHATVVVRLRKQQ